MYAQSAILLALQLFLLTIKTIKKLLYIGKRNLRRVFVESQVFLKYGMAYPTKRKYVEISSGY